MAPASIHSAALTGITARLVTIEAEVSNGQPGILLAGLPDTALRETRDRVRAAVINSAGIWPDRRVSVSLYPASLPKQGSCFDLAIAIAVLTANGAVPPPGPGVMFFAELGLDGHLRPVHGVVPAVIAAAAAGLSTVVVAEANAAEAALLPGIRVIAADRLAAVTGWMRTGGPALIREMPSPADGPSTCPPPYEARHDLADVPGQPQARRALEICAAGGHHLSLTGPPGSEATQLARCLPGILPPLDHDAAVEVTAIWSAAGLLTPAGGLVTRPPLAAPHPDSSKAAVTGGREGSIRPGCASLAHQGVLLLERVPDFSREVLDALRQPLETGQVTLARRGTIVTFPARWILVLTANPCPCTTTAGCRCTAAARRRYLGRVSGPLLGRIAVKVAVQPPVSAELQALASRGESSADVAVRVLAARDRAARRLAGTPWRVNAHVPAAELRRDWAPSPGAVTGLERALDRGQLGERGAASVIRVAWTLADLAGKDRPDREECESALQLGVAQ